MSDTYDLDYDSCSTLLDCPLNFEALSAPTSTYGTLPTRKKRSSRGRTDSFRQSWAAGPSSVNSPELYFIDTEGIAHRYRLLPTDIEVGQRTFTSSPDPSHHVSESAELCAWVMFIILVVVAIVCLTSSDPQLGW
ncbi:hypothetical protein BDP55DRAFT_758917 [Colletotrichum godetiae]|uniref:Uncharacterized protein n=1 Tax=Colletotrichum godetiae TaxID=1209918 RepID=A0AAJ0ERE3_9PEZI|nr:uncharacterized protein BDP55DRAFT_758917 [Colletotrichum godetiae]KAK1658413.1 hypothetical protein BDP55DRAFT_758917 [Colletotrichum godetiae]